MQTLKWLPSQWMFPPIFFLLAPMSAVSFLISDPSPALQTFTQQLLSGYGFDAAAIKTASTPQAAAEIAASHKPDFLITDWFAKEPITGIALHKTLLKDNPNCQFALMAQDCNPTRQQEADEAGALFLLAKPFTADAMRGAVRTALEQLAPLHPGIASKLTPQGSPKPPRPVYVAPPLPQFKPGDRVVYANRTESVKHVILRRGELVLQLDGIPGMVEATKVKRI